MNIPMLLTPKVNTVYLMASSSIESGLKKTMASGYAAVPVLCDDGRYYGTVSCRDFLSCLTENAAEDNRYRHVAEIMDTSVNPAVTIDTDISELLDRLMDTSFVPVTDGRGCFAGIVTRRNMLGYFRKNCSGADWNCYEEAAL